jgi:hypothetical protein
MTQLSQLACPYPPKADSVQRRLSFWFISTETVNSTVKISCEGLTAVIHRKLGDTSRFDQAWNISILTGAMNV